MTQTRAPNDAVHLDDERMAEFVEGTLTPGERLVVERHLSVCAECREIVANTTEVLAATEKPAAAAPLRFPRGRWVMTFAGVAAATIVLAVWLGGGFSGPREAIDALVTAQAGEPVRALEGRLAGFPYAPAPGINRGVATRTPSSEVVAEAAAVETRLGRETRPASQAAVGVAYAVVGSFDAAIEALERAARAEPTARYNSDLAAVYVARGRSTDQRSDYEKAVAAADRALALDARNAEACFNRALGLEMLGTTVEVIASWRRCLEVEPDERWRSEVRQHLASLSP